ncbi:hypothetical protein BCR35DRAFT_328579 [Leucosporidium creatinivorum]|uniref:Uncharacterized protein n=1 Tax=Leucosporidium creatinivorum TaxID=106004 RepID=A0A1Y2G2Z6_9BASI|nr:hypothetical protein BCR35DRAFT_328579 [Leucosporidium creatinivorum]
MSLFTRRHRNATHSHPHSHHTSSTTPRRGGRLHLFSRNGRSRKENRVAGLKAARTNPRTTSAGRKRAKHELHAMGQ